MGRVTWDGTGHGSWRLRQPPLRREGSRLMTRTGNHTTLVWGHDERGRIDPDTVQWANSDKQRTAAALLLWRRRRLTVLKLHTRVQLETECHS